MSLTDDQLAQMNQALDEIQITTTHTCLGSPRSLGVTFTYANGSFSYGDADDCFVGDALTIAATVSGAAAAYATATTLAQ